MVMDTFSLLMKRKERSCEDLPYTCVYTSYEFRTTGISGKSPWGEEKTVQFMRTITGTTKLVCPQNS